MRRRGRSAIAMIVSTVVLGAVLASPVSAAPRWTWDAGFGGWMDEQCDGTPSFQLILYDNINEGGAKAKICGDTGNLANVPRGGSGTTLNFNNQIGSIWAKVVPSGKHIWFHENTGYTPFTLLYANQGDHLNLSDGPWSSIRLL